tara:strand:+ start:385 stop:1053 length:669 start_codon:yes stop_codon:yes gene_type:complete
MILDPIDQNIRDQGFNFVPFDRYLANPFKPYTLDMSGGITTLKPPIFPMPRQGGGGGGDGPGGPGSADAPSPEEQSTTADDFGFGLAGNDPSMNMTEEEKEAIDEYNNPTTTKGMLGTAFAATLGFLNPVTAIASLAYQRNRARDAAMEQAREAATQAAGRGFDMAGTGDTSGGRAGGGGFGGNTAGGFSESDPSATEGSHAYGGRVGYMMGGLTDLVDIYD